MKGSALMRSAFDDQNKKSPFTDKINEHFSLGDEAFQSDEESFVPNSFSLGERAMNTLLALALLAYGAYGLLVDDLYLPGRRSRPGVHLHGTPAWIMYGAFICAAAVLLALVIDHYDRRNNEHHYETFKLLASRAGWSFFIVALLWSVMY